MRMRSCGTARIEESGIAWGVQGSRSSCKSNRDRARSYRGVLRDGTGNRRALSANVRLSGVTCTGTARTRKLTKVDSASAEGERGSLWAEADDRRE